MSNIEIKENILNEFSKKELDLVTEIADNTLDQVIKNKAFFKKSLLLQKIRLNTPEELTFKPKFDAMLNLIVESMHMIELGDKDSGLFTHPKIIRAEEEMLALAAFETSDHILDKELINFAINEKKGISEEQSNAVWDSCYSKKRVTVIEGAAGAGKSFTMAAIKEAYEASGYLVTGAALSWTAAKVLETSTGLTKCKAIEGLLTDIDKAKKNRIDFFRQPTVLIIDEAGLVGTIHMHKLLKETQNAKFPVKVILSGDSSQLNPVAQGNALEAIVNFLGSSRIDTIRRQKQESHRIAVKNFSNGFAGKGLYTYLHQEAIKWNNNKEELLFNVVQDFISYKLAFPEKKALLLALSNKDVITLNTMIRNSYKKLGRIIGQEYTFKVTDGRNIWDTQFSVGDNIVFRKNDKNKLIYFTEQFNANGEKLIKGDGLFNRMSGTITSINKNSNRGYDIVTLIDGEDCEVTINSEEYIDVSKRAIPINHNFATTIYASQGQTVEKVFLLDSPMMQRRLAYVGMSRHTESCDIYLDHTELQKRLCNLLDIRSDKFIFNQTEMLQCVAYVWGQEAKNQTAMMMVQEKKNQKLENRKKSVQDMEKEIFGETCLLMKNSPNDKIIDFIDSYNIQPATVDLAYLMKSEKPIDISNLEYIPEEAPAVHIENGNKLFFHASTTIIPNEDFLEKNKELLWTTGRGSDLRIIAKRGNDIVGRYDLLGKDKLNIGYPPMYLNKQPNKDLPIYICPSAREWFYLIQYFEEKYKDEPNKVPHAIWAAKDVHWEHIAKNLKNKTVFIARSTHDDSQVEWAVNLHKQLNDLGINPEIRPKLDVPKNDNIKRNP